MELTRISSTFNADTFTGFSVGLKTKYFGKLDSSGINTLEKISRSYWSYVSDKDPKVTRTLSYGLSVDLMSFEDSLCISLSAKTQGKHVDLGVRVENYQLKSVVPYWKGLRSIDVEITSPVLEEVERIEERIGIEPLKLRYA